LLVRVGREQLDGRSPTDSCHLRTVSES